MIAMIDHLLCHTAVNTDILACDKASLVRTQEQHHISDIQRSSDTTARLLNCIRTVIDLVAGVDPTRRNRVYPNLARQTDSKCVC